MTKIILVRHGHVEGISPERFRGRADLALTTEGRRQADATARRIHAVWAPAAVYTSPLSRSRETGEAIGKPFGLSPSLVDGLVDIDYGHWQGLTPAEVRARWPELLDTWYRAPDWAAIPGGSGSSGAAGSDLPASAGHSGARRARQRQSRDPAACTRAAAFRLSPAGAGSVCNKRARLLGGRFRRIIDERDLPPAAVGLTVTTNPPDDADTRGAR